MRLTHKDKVKMARRMMTQAEIVAHIPKFSSNAWMTRKFAIMKRLYKTVSRPIREAIETPKITYKWYEAWIPLYIARGGGAKLTLFQTFLAWSLRRVHYVINQSKKRLMIWQH